MSAGKIRVELELDNSGMITGTIQSVAALKNLAGAANSADSSVSGLKGRSSELFQTFKDGVLTVGLLREALKTVYAATGEWAMGIVKTNAELQRMTQLMTGMSTAVSTFGKMKDAKESVQWIIDFTKSAPFSMQTLTDGFVKFKSVGIDPTNGSLRALSDAVAAFGGNDEIFKRATVAIQQMGGKGVISMEELRQQLGEAVPQAINLMARSAGMTYAELVKLISQGRVESTSALKLMFDEFDRTFGGRSQEMMRTWDGMIAQMSSSWIALQKAVGDAGFFGEAQKQLKDLINLMNEPGSLELAKSLGEGLTQIIQYARQGIDWVLRYRTELLKFGEILTTVFAARGAIASAKGLFDILNAFGPTVTRTGGFLIKISEAVFDFGGSMLKAGPIVSGFGSAVATVGVGLNGFGSVLNGLGGPIGIAIMLIGLLTAAYFAFRTTVKDTTDALNNANFYNPDMVDKAEAQLDEFQKKLKQSQSLYDRLTASEDERNQRGYGPGDMAGLKAEVEGYKAQIDDLKRGLARAGAMKVDQDTRQVLSDLKQASEETLQPMHAQYAAAMDDLANREKAGAVKADEAHKERFAIMAKYYEDSANALTNRINSLSLEKKNAPTAEKSAITKEIIDLQEQKQALLAQQDASLKDALNILPGKGGNTGALTKAESMIESYKAKIADLKAEMVNTSGELAKVNSMIAGGVFGNKFTQADADSLRKYAAAFDATSKAAQEYKKAQDQATAASDGMDQKVAALAAKQNELSSAFSSTAAVLKSSGYLNLIADNQKKLADIMAAGNSEENLQKLMDAREKAAESERYYIQNSFLEYSAGLKEKTDALNNSLLTEDEQRQAEYDAEVAHVKEMIALYQKQGDGKKEALQQANDYLLALEKKHERDMEGPIQDMLRNWSNVSKNMQEAGARWLDDLSNRVVEFAKTGKFSFSEFAQSVLSDILRIIEQAAIANSLGQSGGSNGLGGILGGLFSGIFNGIFGSNSGPAGFAGMSGIGNVNTSTGMIGHNHSGGVAGKSASFHRPVDPSVFFGAPRFHGGGMPGLRSDEVPLIAQKGEGIFTRDQMAALGGSINSKPNVQVNVINQSGQAVNANQSQQRFDGKQLVLDVVLKAASQPGAFRDGMKTVLKQ